MRFSKKYLVIPIILSSICFVACGNEWYLKYEDHEISEGMFTYYAVKSYDEAYELRDDSSIKVWDSTVNGENASDWIRNKATELGKEYIIIECLFDECDLSLTEDDESEIEERVYNEYWLDGLREFFGPMGVDEEIYNEIVTNEIKSERLVSYYNDELSKAISDDEIKEYLEDNYASFIYISVAGYYQGEAYNGVEADVIDMEYLYKYICEQIDSGVSIEELARQISQGEFMADETKATEESLSMNSSASDNDRIDVATNVNSTKYPKEFRQQLFEANAGEIIYYEDTSNKAYNIVKKTDILSDSYFFGQYKEDIIKELMAEKFQDKLSDLEADYDIKINNGKIKKIELSNLT